METFVNYNGKIIGESELHISPNNRSFRYGDGFFETMKMIKGKIILQELHFERLFRSLDILQFTTPTHFTPAFMRNQIIDLIEKNKHNSKARIRCTFYRVDGGIHEKADPIPNFIIQSWPAKPEGNKWDENGMSVTIFKDARKSADMFSSIKSNNYLPYIMASIDAQKKKVDDSILLNAFDKICDATIANVFIVTNGTIRTPPISDGPVAGVMRKYLLQELRKEGIPVFEKSISIDDILQASEVFFTNAMIGIKWVKQIEESRYGCQMSSHLYQKFIAPLWKE